MLKIMTMLKKGYVRTLGMGVVAASALAVPAFAAETDMTSVLVTSFETMIADMMASIAAILPVVLPLFGVSMLVAFSIKWFRKITNKAG